MEFNVSSNLNKSQCGSVFGSSGSASVLNSQNSIFCSKQHAKTENIPLYSSSLSNLSTVLDDSISFNRHKEVLNAIADLRREFSTVLIKLNEFHDFNMTQFKKISSEEKTYNLLNYDKESNMKNSIPEPNFSNDPNELDLNDYLDMKRKRSKMQELIFYDEFFEGRKSPTKKKTSSEKVPKVKRSYNRK
jgi:hypothetical protein